MPPMASPWPVSQRSHVHEKMCNPLHSAFTQPVSFVIMEIVMLLKQLAHVHSGQLRFLG